MSLVRLLKPIVEKFPSTANYYRYVRDSKALSAEVTFRKNLGFFFNGNTSMEEGVFEPDETLIIESLLGSFDVFVNIGANTGHYVCKALSRGIDTIAFEPNQLNVNILLRNINANKFQADFQLFPVALSNQLGVLPMYGGNVMGSLIEGWAGNKTSTLVPISVFDKTASPLVQDKKCLILIDIEGAELGCLKGAQTLLSSSQNNVFLVEISVTEHQPSGIEINPNLLETFKLMYSYGYSAYTADSKLREIELSEVENVSSNHINSLGTHNFLFVKGEEVLNSIDFR